MIAAVTRLLGISGSLRRTSYNTALLRAAVRLMPPAATLDVATIRGIPLYDYDVEVQGIPPAVSQLKEAIAKADGLPVRSAADRSAASSRYRDNARVSRKLIA